MQAEEVQRTDPEFLSRVILYGLTRRSIYRHLRQQTADSLEAGAASLATLRQSDAGHISMLGRTR